MTRARSLPLVALALALLVSVASAQPVRYTVEVRDGSDRAAALDGFRGGDLLDLIIGIHNAGEQALEPGSVYVVLPPAEGLRTQIATSGLAYTDPERFVDSDGRVAAGFEPNLTAYYPALVDPLPPGANHQVRIRLSVVSSANDLAGLVEALRLNNRFDRTIGTRVDELPPPVAAPATDAPTTVPAPAPDADTSLEAVAQHIASMFGHLGAVRYTCPPIPGANPERTICGEVLGTFREVQQGWDLYFDWASETPITARAIDAWSRNDNGTYSRAFMIDGLVFLVTYVSVDDAPGVIVVLIGD